MTGLEFLRASGTTVEEIADVISSPCPPVIPEKCDRLSCRECWFAWLTTGESPKEDGDGKDTGESLELDRLRHFLREMDDYVNGTRQEEGPPKERAARDDEELARLRALLREVDDYVNGKSHDHTSQ